jgi:PilZ domain-containing protein
MVERQTSDWVRRGPRRPARLMAEAEWPDGVSGKVVVTELSYTGCRLASTRDFVRGETVRLFLPNLGQVHAQIRWVREGLAGAHFLTGDSTKDARRARLGV